MRSRPIALVLIAGNRAGCSAFGPREGDLIEQFPGEFCAPYSPGSARPFTPTQPDNTRSSDPIQVHSIELIGADGLEFAGAWLLPVPEWSQESNGGPLTESALAEVPSLSQENPATIEPSGERGLIVALEPDEDGGSFEHLRVFYQRGKTQYYSDGEIRVRIAAKGAKCSSPDAE